jgi:hypothetical protein
VKIEFIGRPVRELLSTWLETISEVSRAHACNGIVGSARPFCRDSGCDIPAEKRCARQSVSLLKTDSCNVIGF